MDSGGVVVGLRSGGQRGRQVQRPARLHGIGVIKLPGERLRPSCMALGERTEQIGRADRSMQLCH
jgi:hypothetical protein